MTMILLSIYLNNSLRFVYTRKISTMKIDPMKLGQL